jgi:hypothetical protein
VLQLLKEQQLYAKPSKCFFGVEVEYLGHIVSHEGVKVDPNKIKAMMNWLIPKTLKNLRGFLGLTGYYHQDLHQGPVHPGSCPRFLNNPHVILLIETTASFFGTMEE